MVINMLRNFRRVLLAWLPLSVAALQAQPVEFDRWFDGRTLRIDCLREGNAAGDTVWVERWTDRGNAWHGSRTQLTDPFDNGDYRVEMRDAVSGRLIYSRGYSNLFREYKDTPEGRRIPARFEETLLLPMPRGAVQIALQKRDIAMHLYDATVLHFDPAAQQLQQPVQKARPYVLERHGNPDRKVDVVLVMQGYDGLDGDKLRSDMRRMQEALFGQEPFTSHRTDFNVYGVSADVGAAYGTFGAQRYLMTFDLWHLHDAIGATPCDFIIIVVNDSTYGGGAIYNFYAVTSLHRQAEFVLPHELGHAVGGLADEYVDENLSYGAMHRTPHEPLEPNITNLTDFASKWLSMLPPHTPVPTPPDDMVPRNECGPLGVYEGAGYATKGLYRPAMHCMMRDYAPFCPVCRRRLEAVFGLYTR
ncbi:MAG: IgA Peptidase M64 [bacterium F083]|nr:MAG: IgA Peptidase M64 [bacterium F083]